MRYVMMMVLALICLNLSTAQAEVPYERESLAGLPGVLLVVEKLSAEAQAWDLTEEAVQEAVELILRSSGIRVFNEPKPLNVPSHAWLYVQPNIGKSGSSFFYNVSIRLIQEVSAVNGRKQPMAATTWEGNTAGIVNDGDLRDAILDVVQIWAKRFANDFLTVNPR